MNDERMARFGAGSPSDDDPPVAAEDDVEILGIEAVEEDEEAEAVEPERAARPSPLPAPAVAGDHGAAGDEIAVLKDRHLRLLADFDNYRKRAEREREERARYALSEPLRELMPVVDNLDRALAAKGSFEDLRRGVEMTARQFEETLRRFGVTVVPAVGERFDPRFHEAVSRLESGAVDAPTVVEEMQRGYKLHDRLLRPAMVRVAVPVERGHAADTAPAADAGPPPDAGTGEEE